MVLHKPVLIPRSIAGIARQAFAFNPRPTPPIWLLVMITISGTMAMHMFVPALPSAGRSLAASPGEMQMTISLYIFGLATGQLVYGPLSDALGRRPVLIAGLSLYSLAGLCAALAPTLNILLAARLAEGLGGCAGLALGRAIVRDTTVSDAAVRQLALMNLMMMVGPGLAPMAGGLFATHLGWRAIFWTLGWLGVLTVWLSWRLLPETVPERSPFGVGVLLSNYRDLLSSPKFLGFAIGGACTTTAVYAFIAAAPFLITERLGRTASETGVFLGGMIVGMVVGNALTGRLIRRVSIDRLMLTGNSLCIASALVLLGTFLADGVTLVGTFVIMLFFTCGSGMASPAALTKSISVDLRHVGAAAGLYGCGQMMVGALATMLAALGANPGWSAGLVLLGATALGQAAFWTGLWVQRREGRQAPQMPISTGSSARSKT